MNYQFWINGSNINICEIRSKTFWEIKDEISFSNAEVHLSGLGDFEIDDMDHGIQMNGFEEIECDGMVVEVIGVNILTD